MKVRQARKNRRGGTLIETVIVIPVVLNLMLGTMIAASGVFTNIQIAMLAREGTRYAATHGAQYVLETGSTASTPATVFQNGIQPMAAGVNWSQLTYSVTWDDSSQMPSYYNASTGAYVTNNVHVTVSYPWSPVKILPATTFTSTSVMPMAY